MGAYYNLGGSHAVSQCVTYKLGAGASENGWELPI